MFRYQPPSSKHTSHFSFSERLGDSETYFNLGELPFYFTTIWIWENPKKILSPKNVDFFLDMLENVFLPPRLLALSLEVKNPGKMNGWEPPNNGGGLVGLFR